MTKKKRTKKYNAKVKAKTKMTGLVSSWQVEDPLAETKCLTNTYLFHENPLNNLLLIKYGERKTVYKAMVTQRYKWKIEITMHFDNGLQTSEEYRVFIFTGLINNGDEAWASVIEEMFDTSDTAYYKHTTMKCTIMGIAPIKESDYEDSMVPLRRKHSDIRILKGDIA